MGKQPVRDAANLRIEWDDRWKRWVLTGTLPRSGQHPLVYHFEARTTSALDGDGMFILMEVVRREMESWLF